MPTQKRIYTAVSWIIVLWIAKVFLTSIPYKFSGHPDTMHIFSTIGSWMATTLSVDLGSFFAQYGAIVVGSAELATSLLLLSPLVLLVKDKMSGQSSAILRSKIHAVGGLVSSGIMAGAVFFHLFTPLGIEVLHEGKSDGGSLFMAAFSILILGLVLCAINLKLIKAE
ncbi:hypothetical protein HWV00_05010 [Moritella sp. 24]|uniref:hypothetical protein n=1 Tax=Moritella sp. 24 TaxID=2746230 RepID=UPI001BAD6B0A|nr:hypothetical protein [Moritella sp. 24]QUM75645.1 hypothetical protein HWV00_05010 [Moritella sp. 24]